MKFNTAYLITGILGIILFSTLSFVEPFAEVLTSQKKSKTQKEDYAKYVNQFLGTSHSRWMIAPGPWMLMEMVKISLENQESAFKAGYDYEINNIMGLRHTYVELRATIRASMQRYAFPKNEATIYLSDKYYNGNTFVIKVKNASKENKYIELATLNGKKLNSWKFPQKELVKGGKLILEMGLEPNKKWRIN